jgi:hypothetical protein
MLKSERNPCDRVERDGYPFDDIGELVLPQGLLYGPRAGAALVTLKGLKKEASLG